MSHFVSASAGGKCSMCESPATHKVGEEIPNDEPCHTCGSTWYRAQFRHEEHPPAGDPALTCDSLYHHLGGAAATRHNLTAYVCCRCFTLIMGGATGCPVETKTVVTFEGREWILLQRVRASDDGKIVGYTVLECGEGGAAKLPADVKYIEFPVEAMHGNDT